jgi:TctA family transporter
VLTHIWVREGPRALIRGMFPRMMLHGPASAATFVCYEQVLRLSRRERGTGAVDGAAAGLGSTHAAAAASPRS